jgi:Tfp pilus assembly protein PilF
MNFPLGRQFAAAQAMFEQAIRDKPNFAEAHNNLGFTT